MEAEKKGRLAKMVKDGRDAEDMYNRFIKPWADKALQKTMHDLENATDGVELMQCQGYYKACLSIQAEFQHYVMEGKRAQKKLEEENRNV